MTCQLNLGPFAKKNLADPICYSFHLFWLARNASKKYHHLREFAPIQHRASGSAFFVGVFPFCQMKEKFSPMLRPLPFFLHCPPPCARSWSLWAPNESTSSSGVISLQKLMASSRQSGHTRTRDLRQAPQRSGQARTESL